MQWKSGKVVLDTIESDAILQESNNPRTKPQDVNNGADNHQHESVQAAPTLDQKLDISTEAAVQGSKEEAIDKKLDLSTDHAIQDSRQDKNQSSTRTIDPTDWSYEAALQYLNETGEIIWFQQESRDRIFHNKEIFFETISRLFDHDLESNLKNLQEKNKDFTFNSHQINQGVICEKTFDLIFQNKFLQSEKSSDMASPKMIARKEIEELLNNLGVIATTEIYDEAMSDSPEVGPSKVFIVPALINTPITHYTRGKSSEEIFHQFPNHIQFTFVFGEQTCFSSAGVMEALLVTLYMKYLKSEQHSQVPEATCYREAIELRMPGVVFCIEFYPAGKTGNKITIFEEERVTSGEKEEKYYKNRLIHVFAEPGKDTESNLRIIITAIKEAIRNVIKDEHTVEQTVQNCGLKCLKCFCTDGIESYIRGSFHQEKREWKCVKNPDHLIKHKMVFSEEYNEYQDLVIRRYALAVRTHCSK